MDRVVLLRLLLVLGVGSVLFPRLGAAPPSEKAEERCLDVVENMVATGDWLVPMRGGEPRLQKPPLYYWAATAVSDAAGGATPGTLRFVSACAALLLLALTMTFAASISADRWLAPTAGASLACMLQTYTLGREATAEMTLALLCCGALAVYWRVHSGALRARRGLPLFSALLALALLTKATSVLLVVGAPIAAHLAITGRIRDALRPRTALWVAAAFLPLIAWYGAILATVPGAWDALYRELVLPLGVETAEHSAAHFRGITYYASKLPAAAAPAALLIPVLAWRAARGRAYRDEPAMRFLFVVLVTMFTAFSLLPQKQKHYLLPAVPALAILLANAARWALSTHPWATLRAIRVSGPLLAAVGACAMSALGWLLVSAGIQGPCAALALGALVLVLLVAAAAAALVGRPARFALLFVPAFLGLAHAHFTRVEVWRIQVDHAAENHLPVPDEPSLLALARRHPTLISLFNIDDSLEAMSRRRDDAPPR